MQEEYRYSCVKRQDKNRGKDDPIRVSFYDIDGIRVNDVTRKEARCIAALNPQQLFYFEDGNGYQRELLIQQVNELDVIDALPDAPVCPTNPKLCGPPRVQFFGGTGMGAMANAVISPNSSSVIGFDIVNRGFNYLTPPFANIVDECGSGSGSRVIVQTQPYGTAAVTGAATTAAGATETTTAATTAAAVAATTAAAVAAASATVDRRGTKGGLEVKNIVVLSPGDGYLPAPNGSLGGNGRIWKKPNESYVKTKDENYYIVPSGLQPPNLSPEDTFFPPEPLPTPQEEPSLSYPVVTEIEEVYIDRPGFGYEPGDTIVVTPDNGAILEPVINGRGEIIRVNIVSPGIGFIDLPTITVNSPRGYNASLIPVLKVTPISQIPDPTIIPPGTQLISVVDCVGRIPPQVEFDRVPR
jgi:hypothetical protein